MKGDGTPIQSVDESLAPGLPSKRIGEMSERVRAFDWTQTPLGAPAQWPQSLRTVVNILLTSRFSMWMGWGEQLTFFYNDDYRPTLGMKHPWALGRPAQEVWSEIWPDVEPRIRSVLTTGEATFDAGLLLFLLRSGFPEETYHTFSYSPLLDDAGRVNGMFCVVSEETDRIISERRMATLREFASALSSCTQEHEVLNAARSQLGANTRDLPFTLIYLFDPNGNAHLATSAGIEAGHWAAPAAIPFSSDEPWPAHAVFGGRASHLVDPLPFPSTASAAVPLPAGAWDQPPQQALVVPIKQQAHDRPAGFLIVGVNPYRRCDSVYSGFVDLIAGQLAAALATAHAYEEERRRAKALAELDRAKTQFFANISHELRTPLTLMLGPLEDTLALDRQVPGQGFSDQVTESLTVVHRNSLRLLRLVNSLLDFSRIEAGRMTAHFEPTDLSAFTAELASGFRSATERADLFLEVDCPSLPEPVFVDREMWEKIILNLLSNAFKFTFTGGITVRLHAHDNAAVLQVADTGTGIPESELPRLFERFHRVEGARGRTYEGTGIGLALVQELVRQHGGSIAVASTVGQGTTFTLSLPFGVAHLAPEHLSGSGASFPAGSRGGAFVEEALRWLPHEHATLPSPPAGVPSALPTTLAPESQGVVLLADDNADMRDYIHRLLSPHYRVIAVNNGEEALAAALAERPDLVLSDVMMPGLDGFGLLDALRANPGTRTVPVLLLSARAGEDDRSVGMEAGADDYLVKPFSSRELLARVGAHLKLARARKEAEEQAATILESISDGFLAVDRHWSFIYVNRTGEQMVGFGHGELLGKTFWEAFPPVLGTIFETEYRRAMEQRVAIAFETLYEPWQRWFSVRVFPTHDGGLSIYLRDVTEPRRVAEVVRAAEEELRLVADVAPVSLIHCDREGRYLFTNRSNAQRLGRDPEEMVGRHLSEVLGPENYSFIHPHLQKVLSGEPVSFELEMTYPAIGRRHMQISYVPELDPDQTVRGFVGAISDITSRKDAEDALRAGQERLQAALDASGTGTFRWDVQTDSLTWDEACDRLFGFPASGADRSLDLFLSRVHPDDRQLILLSRDRSRHRGADFEIEFRIFWPDGAERWFYGRGRTFRDDSGQPAYITGACVDITGRKRAEETLQESEIRFRQLADSMPHMVWTARPDGFFDYFNQRWYAFTDLDLSLQGNDAWASLVHPDDRQRALDAWDLAVQSGEPNLLEFRFRDRTENRWRWFLARAIPVRDAAGNIKKWFGTWTDIDEQKATQQAVLHTQKLESIGLLAGGIAHDFNNLLVGIMGGASFALDTTPESHPAYPLLQGVVLASERAAHLTRQMLAYAGKGKLLIEPIDLSLLVSTTAPLVSASIPKSVRVELDLEDPLPAVLSDPGQMQQVAMNLIINAAEAIGERSGVVVVRTRAEEVPPGAARRGVNGNPIAPGLHAVFEVEDTGPGIDPTILTQIFDPFFSTKFTGRGLGLAAVQGIVQSHRGAIEVETTLGRGSVFRVLLPATPARTPSPADSPTQPPARGCETFLIIDDEVFVRLLAESALVRSGYRAILAASGAEGLDCIRHNPDIALVLLDMNMPGMNGRQMLEALRAIRPALPVVVCTGYTEEEINDRFFGLGIAGVLCKPFTTRRLLETVRAALNRSPVDAPAEK